ncbi:hypothetical protein J7E62_07965 [Variovorax paradoxus]|nr:hypothetical protein [Variovorax paradoxus]
MDLAAASPTMSRVAVGGAAGSIVETKAAVETPGPGTSKVTKVIVAVHGVGDQHQYATIQSVVGQFCRYYRTPPATPLGSFHNAQRTYAFKPPLPAPQLEKLAFAEVYWATIPRGVVTDQHTLEEAKKWAGTIVERLRLRWKQGPDHLQPTECRDEDFRRLKQVLAEMIQSVAVLERLCYLGDRAGLFTFDLRKLLDDYLGDVQVVAEFEQSRVQILKAFSEALDLAHRQYPKAELYIVAHSEGTVVSFLGLLEAFRSAATPEWAQMVRGLMTFGSPIDKHLMLWPELFDGPEPAWVPPNATEKIEWRNYYDRGDPIGFELDDVRAWIARGEANWGKVFNFEQEHDMGFIRYPFPGKAHVDYWDDDAVFGHFISTVVKPDPRITAANTGKTAAPDMPAPPDDRIYKYSSYVLPYVGILLMLFLAAYFPYKAIVGYVDAKPHYHLLAIALDVAGVAFFLLGITVAARVPRLTRVRFWRAGAWVACLSCALIGWWLVGLRMGERLEVGFGLDPSHAGPLAVLGLAVIVVSRALGAVRPSWGLKPLVALGTAMLLGMAVWMLWGGELPMDGKLWPVVLAVAAFIYLWWLAVLIFDLAFVWHVHIRQSTAMKRLRLIFPPPNLATPAPSAVAIGYPPSAANHPQSAA